MKKRADKLSSIVFCVLITLIVLLAISNYLTSGLYARYLSFGDSGDDARVAKWEINFKDKDGNVKEIMSSDQKAKVLIAAIESIKDL